MAITFPENCNQPADRMEYLHRRQEKLRLLHNEQGARRRSGELTEKEWNDWLADDWGPEHNETTEAILEYRGQLQGRQPGKHTPRWEPDVSHIPVKAGQLIG